MQKLSNDQKADLYNKLLFQYQRLQEEIRLIKADNINVTDKDQLKIEAIERKMKQVYAETQRLYV